MDIIGRNAAKAAGLKRYFTGKPCINGHFSERAVVNATCCECVKIKNREIKRLKGQNSSKHIKKRARESGEKDFWTGRPCSKGHLDFRRLSDSKCRTCIKEKCKVSNKKRSEYMKIAIKASQHKRRAAKAKGSGVLASDILEKLKYQDYKCVYCKADISASHHMDHIMPLALGGEHSVENIQCTCATCNFRKSAKHPDEWMLEFQRTKNAS